MNINIQVELMKALADVTRLTIVKKLAQVESLNCSELSKTFHLTQPTLSHHFKKLIDVDIIIAKKEATHMIYSLNKSLLAKYGINV